MRGMEITQPTDCPLQVNAQNSKDAPAAEVVQKAVDAIWRESGESILNQIEKEWFDHFLFWTDGQTK